MRDRFRVPLFVAVAALLALIAVLATLQYQWLGRISDAQRERLKATLNAHATAFAQDVDRELTRAYLTFQFDPVPTDDGAAARTAARFDRWQATAKYPKLVKDVYLVSSDDPPRLERFNPTSRSMEPAEWSPALAALRADLGRTERVPTEGGTTILKTLPPAVIDDVPAIVVPTPLLVVGQRSGNDIAMSAPMVCTVLLLDRQYIEHELLPALTRQHFRGTGDGIDYQVAVVRPASNAVVYHSEEQFSPSADARVDAATDLFQVRLQDFSDLVSEVRRFSTFMSAIPHTLPPAAGRRGSGPPLNRAIVRETFTLPSGPGQLKVQQGAPLSIVVEQTGPLTPERLAAAGAVAARVARTATPRWRLMVKHPAGSLERAVDSTRMRNLWISSGILAILGVSLGFLVVSTRRAHALARQQMEFVATVSHELRTPLAVIRSAADNLADGVVTDEGHVRRYGELVRTEGRRLSELVEQVLEYAGLQSDARKSRPRPVALDPLLRDVTSSARATADAVRVTIELTMQDGLPAVAGDEAALGRVFQNLVGNAIKYGADGRWVGVDARVAGDVVEVSIADRGIGIAAADQTRIFDPFYRAPDVVAAQIQGAGLGLSLVKRIVDAHGGRIEVKSAPGAGSTFIVTLPIAGTAAEAASGVGAAAEQQP
jgi:signal transduction histidine kinase